jgi:hypothetical protein
VRCTHQVRKNEAKGFSTYHLCPYLGSTGK